MRKRKSYKKEVNKLKSHHIEVIKSEIKELSSEFVDAPLSIGSRIRDKFHCFGHLSSSEYENIKSQIKSVLSKYFLVDSVSEHLDKGYVSFSFKCFTKFSQEDSIINRLEEISCA